MKEAPQKCRKTWCLRLLSSFTRSRRYMYSHYFFLPSPIPAYMPARTRVNACEREGWGKKKEGLCDPLCLPRRRDVGPTLATTYPFGPRWSSACPNATRGHTVAHGASAGVAEKRRANRYFRADFHRKMPAGTATKLERVCFRCRNVTQEKNSCPNQLTPGATASSSGRKSSPPQHGASKVSFGTSSGLP